MRRMDPKNRKVPRRYGAIDFVCVSRGVRVSVYSIYTERPTGRVVPNILLITATSPNLSFMYPAHKSDRHPHSAYANKTPPPITHWYSVSHSHFPSIRPFLYSHIQRLDKPSRLQITSLDESGRRKTTHDICTSQLLYSLPSSPLFPASILHRGSFRTRATLWP